jgi:OOP family OmpA-OmpF porin
MKIFTIVFSITFLLFTQSIFSQNIEDNHINPLSKRFVLNLEGGITYPQTDFRKDKISYLGQLSLDYFFPSSGIGVFGLRGYGYYGQLEGTDGPLPTVPSYYTEIAALGGGIHYTINASKVFYPYVFLGADYLFFNPLDSKGNKLPVNKTGVYSNITWSAVGEIGSRFFVSRSVSFNIAANYHYVPIDKLDDVDNSISGGKNKDMFFTARAGISFYFGGVMDSDNDGVSDDKDMCPDTPLGVAVDEFGCPVDSDKDGVPDYLDKCPNTPVGVRVDSDGCPIDSDNDGVPDYLDKCPNTPIGVKVDSDGCPIDSDNDGVPDYLDKCPNTPVGTEVDKNGCPVEEKVIKPIEKSEIILNSGVTFASGKSDLLPAAYTDLAKLVDVMKDHPGTNWKIDGYTDNTGSRKLNKKLSLDRAQSVYNYFVSKGISGSRLFVNGFGSDFPIASNKTESGKAQNRRVVISLVSGINNNKIDLTKKYDATVEKNVGNMIFTDGYFYCFQVSSWRTMAKAETEANKLKSKGYKTFITTANLPELDGTWYRVRIGYFNTLDEAKKVRDEVVK